MIENNNQSCKSTESVYSVANNSVVTRLQPNYNIARGFIEEFGSEYDRFTFQIIPDSKEAKAEDKGKILHGSLKKLWNQLVDWNQKGYCISFVPNSTNLKGRKKEDITHYRCFFIDNDNGSPQKYHLEPSIIVRTSRENSHSYWLFSEKRSVEDWTQEKYLQLNKKLAEHYDADLKANEVNKALRMPGLIYQRYEKKTDNQAEKSIVTFKSNNVSYDLFDLVDSIDELPDKFGKLLKEKIDWLIKECSEDPENSKGKLFQIAELLSKTAKELKNEEYLELLKEELSEIGELIDLDKDKCLGIIESAIKSGYYRNKGFNSKKPKNQKHFNKLDDLELARNILESGSVDYLCEDFEDWTKVGMCLHSISDELLTDWDNWSSQSERYEHDCCEKSWKNFKSNGGLNIGSLIHWAEKSGWVNPNKSKRSRNDNYSENNTESDKYLVDKTIDYSIYKVLFDEGKGSWITINNLYHKYLPEKGYWERQTEEKIKQIIAEETTKFYVLGREGLNYKFCKDSSIVSSFNFCSKILALVDIKQNEHLIPFTNGTYNIENKTLEKHDKNNHLTWGIDSEYQKVYDCPKVFKDFIVSSFGEEYIELIRAIISMYLDPTAPYGYFVHLIGKSGSGKGTLIKLLQSLFQESCTTSINHFSELQSPEKRHQLLSGIKLCIAPDVNQYQGSISAFYELVDNGSYSGRALYSSESYDKHWNCRFLLASTQLLGIENAAEGWNRRCINLQLKERLGNPDTDLANKLKSAKAEIISWALNIEKKERDNLLINAHNFEPIRKIKLQQETFADSVKAFFDGCTNYDPEAPLLTDSEIYKRYKIWCKTTNYQAIKITSFKHKLNEMFGAFKTGGKVYKDKTTKKTVRESVRWKYIKFIPYLFTTHSEYSSDLVINESKLQEGNIDDFMDSVTKLHQYENGYTNKNSIDVTAESIDIYESQDSVTKLHQYPPKVLKNEKNGVDSNIEYIDDEYIEENKVSPAIDVTFVTDRQNTDISEDSEVTSKNVTDNSIGVTTSKKCNHVTGDLPRYLHFGTRCKVMLSSFARPLI